MQTKIENAEIDIPSMGGDKLKDFLEELLPRLTPNTSIVEVGVWLGAGTSQIASLLRQSGMDESIDIHCYDRWQASHSEAEKASKHGITIKAGDDTLPLVKSMLSSYVDIVHFHQCDLSTATWEGGAISLYIDDAAKNPELFYHVLKTFGPYWIPGKTIIILMDYYYWKKESGRKSVIHRCQQDFIEQYDAHFELIEDFKSKHDISFSNEAFIYKKQLDFGSLHMPPVYHSGKLQSALNKCTNIFKDIFRNQ